MAWTKEQQLAIDKQGGNILVAASAGSGKTAVLVERIIQKILKGTADIDRLLIVTFTKAAASEMKERITKAIYLKLDEDPGNTYLKRQLSKINRACITTMDAFFLDVVKSNFYTCGVDPNISIVDNMQVFVYKEEAILAVIDEEFEKENNLDFERIYNVTCSANESAFKDLIFQLHTYIQSFPYPLEWLEEQVEKYNISTKVEDFAEVPIGKYTYDLAIEKLETMKSLMELCIDLVEKDDQFGPKYTQTFNEDLNNINICIKCSNNKLDMLYQNLNMPDFFKRMPSISKKEFIENEELKEHVASIRIDVKKKHAELRKIIYASTDVLLQDFKDSYRDLRYLANLVISLDTKLEKIKKEKNQMEFADVGHAALNILVDRVVNEHGETTYVDTEVAKRYKEKFDEIYIDEYQDSNYVQEVVLSSVSKKAEGAPNQFMVGDIKQSIYRFRQAMPEIFMEKYDAYKTDAEADFCKILLSKNFRSRKEVIDGINYIFKQVMSKDAGDCSYVGPECLSLGAAYLDAENVDYSMEINLVDTNEEEQEVVEEYVVNDEIVQEIQEAEKTELEAENIAEKIKELIDGNEEKGIKPYLTYDLKKKEFRKLKYKDIVILLRSKGSAKPKDQLIEDVLKKQGIPVFNDGNTSLLNAEEVIFVTSFLELLDNWYQDIPLVSMMFSIVGKFTLDEIVKIRTCQKNGYIFDALLEAKNLEDKELVQKVNNFLELIEKFTYYSKYYGISELLWKIYNETNIYEQYLLKENGPQKCANLDALIDLAVSFESSDYKGLYHFLTYIKSVKEGTSKESAKIIGENEDVVRIMTIHKSKGLEFPIVFIADCQKKFNTKDTTKPVVTHHKLGIAANVISYVDNIVTKSHPSIVKFAVAEKIKNESISEEMRMLYVAMTRAKEKLIISGVVKDLSQKVSNQVIIKSAENTIDKTCVLGCSSYLDLILLAINSGADKGEAKIKTNVTYKAVKKLALVEEEKEIDIFTNWEQYTKSVVDEDISDIKNILEYEYPFKESIQMQHKYSVSEIKKMQNAEYKEEKKVDEEEIIENLETAFVDKEKTYPPVKVPKFMRVEDATKYSGAQKGTLIHLVLNYLDFKNVKEEEDIKKIVDTLIAKGLMTNEERKYIPLKKIMKLVNSKLGLAAKEAIKIEKEKPFVYYIDTNEIPVLRDNIKAKDKLLVQGIIDMYLEDKDGEYVLVDYKSDKLEEDEMYINKYKVQLEIYKKALESISLKKVKAVYIYSIHKDKEIEIKFE
ncbi:MAG: helicase-exonuclease AddAB subunit AddA [Clostridia bacterium]